MYDREELNNPHYNDCYFSYDEGVEEALYVFVDGNGFPAHFFKNETLHIGETGYGTGLNAMALVSVLPESYSGVIHFYSVEKYPLSSERIIELLGGSYSKISSIADSFLQLWQGIDAEKSGWVDGIILFGRVQFNLHLYLGDVQDFLQELPRSMDYWFLDGHSPDKNPDMWSGEVMQLVGDKSHRGTRLATFSAAGKVKNGLREAGFFIKRRKGFGGKRHMIQGIYGEESLHGNS